VHSGKLVGIALEMHGIFNSGGVLVRRTQPTQAKGDERFQSAFRKKCNASAHGRSMTRWPSKEKEKKEKKKKKRKGEKEKVSVNGLKGKGVSQWF